MRARTEEEILSRSPIKVLLGGELYTIPILAVLKTREWRTKLNETLYTIVNNFQVETTDTPVALSNGLVGALVKFPERVAELLFAYAPDLPQERILNEATEEQIAAAFSAVMQVAFPFLPQLGMVRQVVQSALDEPQR